MTHGSGCFGCLLIVTGSRWGDGGRMEGWKGWVEEGERVQPRQA